MNESQNQVNEPSAPSVEAPKVTTPSAPGQPKSKKSLLLVLALLLLLVVGGLAYWLVSTNLSENTQTAAETKEIELLRIGTTDGPVRIFPSDETSGVYFSLNRQIYEGLIGSDKGKFVPLLAESWTNPDENTWAFKLKPNVKFHSGKTMTAADVKASLERLKDEEYWSIFVSTIKDITVVSDTEVTITTQQPDSLMLNRLSLAWVTDNVTDPAKLSGTGAYTLKTDPAVSDTSASLAAFDDYHQGRPKTRNLTFEILPSDKELAAALKDGKIDIMGDVFTPAIDTELKAGGFGSIEFQAPGSFGLYMNMRRAGSPLQNKDVRQAIAHVLNREELITKTESNNQPATQVVPKSLPGYDASIKAPEFSIEKSKELQAKAGYPNGVSLTFAYLKDVQVDAPVLIDQLTAAGFKITPKVYTDADTMFEVLTAGNFDLFAASYSSDVSDARDIFGGILSSDEGTFPVLASAEYDKMLEDSDKEFDPTKRIKLLQGINAYIAQEILWIPLRNISYVTYLPKDVDVGIDYDGAGLMGAYYWEVGRKVN